MTKEIRTGIPEASIEAKNNLVQVTVPQTLDRINFPFWKRGRECDHVRKSLRVLSDALLEHSERQGTQNSIALNCSRIRMVSGVRCCNLTAGGCVSDLPYRGVELDVEAFGECDGNAGVTIADGQVAPGESKTVILIPKRVKC